MKKRIAAVALTLTGIAPMAVAPGAAQAASPVVAKSYASLMYRSLTADAAMATLRGTLVAQQKDLRIRTAEVTADTDAGAAALRRLAGVVAAHAAVHERLKNAERALTAARNTLARASQQRPRSGSAVVRATKTVAAARKLRDFRRTNLHKAAATVRTAQAEVRTTAGDLEKATAAQQGASAAIVRTQQRIATAGTAADFAAQAAAVSREVVDEVRLRFAVTDTVSVYGVTVNKTVGYAFKRMVDDARADGVVLSGGGFRTKERQIELRKINGCPDVWTAPSSSCRVPTAIPGRSLHEIGLAVDITSEGRSLTRKSPAFTWLAAHAADYGYVNLPSEPWHWSITGG